MKVVRRLGNNAAVALDGNGKEIIVLGKGISSGTIPFEINDISIVEKSFYNVNPMYMNMIGSISNEVLMASADVVEQAEFNLDCELNPNLTFTLADHLQFAIKRFKEGMDIPTPIAYDVMHLYPEEYELGLLALDIIQDYTSVKLPENEAINVTLHIINSKIESGENLYEMMETLDIIEDMCKIIEEEMKIEIDRSSYEYARFIMHIRYLLQRLASGKEFSENEPIFSKSMIIDYPEVYGCVEKIAGYLKENKSWKLSKEEKIYLMIHIIRLKNKTL